MTVKYYSTVETAKEIRKTLKTAFPKSLYPGLKFSVRSRKYSGGSSIDISWVDGPKTKDVDAVVDMFQGADFDGMQDMKIYRDNILYNGSAASFGVDFIFCSRSASEETEMMFAEACAEYYQVEGAIIDGKIQDIPVENAPRPGQWFPQVIWHEISKWDANDGKIESASDLPTSKEIAESRERYEKHVEEQAKIDATTEANMKAEQAKKKPAKKKATRKKRKPAKKKATKKRMSLREKAKAIILILRS